MPTLYVPPIPAVDSTALAARTAVWDVARPVLQTIRFIISEGNYWHNWPAEQAPHMSNNVIRAQRIRSDNQVEDVVLKVVKRSSKELAVLTMLWKLKGLTAHACPPILTFVEVTTMPSFRFVVMPPLMPLKLEEMCTVGDAVDFVGQMLEAVQFLHGLGVSHGDISTKNIMVLPPAWARLSVQRHHASTLRYSYCLIDFSFGDRFGPYQEYWTFRTDGPDVVPPEVKDNQSSLGTIGYNPFAADIWLLSRVIKFDLLYSKANLRFLTKLANGMSEVNPGDRFTAELALNTFHNTLHELRSSDYLQSIVRPDLSNVLM
ncbi:hypothetical protein CALVIDRAFT_559574 [Calocera viscosa TUFC12733]|uniref:Protein kinase domain-containing protein n=1 Tax=Calocera viscosa (strain TUFC12733) TaxID=1330018 RepID=A0A167SC59_CALVF|nr:hypothetical protein CALVIDRAFT_559574 [Calocera viscosa TUFC12733]